MRKAMAAVLVVCAAALVLAAATNGGPVKVLVVYYSEGGHTRAMAEAVADGARAVDGVDVTLLPVQEATSENVLESDAVIVGSPVYKANPAPEVLSFIKEWPIRDPRLPNKIGAAFATGSGISAGEEGTQLALLHAMLVCQMIVVGGPGANQPFGASAVGENPFYKPEEGTEPPLVQPYYLDKGAALGRRVAELAVRVND